MLDAIVVEQRSKADPCPTAFRRGISGPVEHCDHQHRAPRRFLVGFRLPDHGISHRTFDTRPRTHQIPPRSPTWKRHFRSFPNLSRCCGSGDELEPEDDGKAVVGQDRVGLGCSSPELRSCTRHKTDRSWHPTWLDDLGRYIRRRGETCRRRVQGLCFLSAVLDLLQSGECLVTSASAACACRCSCRNPSCIGTDDQQLGQPSG